MLVIKRKAKAKKAPAGEQKTDLSSLNTKAFIYLCKNTFFYLSMTKRRIKIVILFVLIITILIGGWQMYRRLKYNRQSFDTDLYSYVSPQATEVININRGYNFEKLFLYEPSLSRLIETLGDNIHYPVIISKYANGKMLLAMKASHEQEYAIREYIDKQISLPFPPKIVKYKDAEIYIHALTNSEFLVYSFYKGLFFVSHHYKPVENILNSDPENTFFSGEKYKEIIEKVRLSAPVSMYIKVHNDMLAIDYNIHNDTIQMEGYILNLNEGDAITPNREVIPFMINLPDSICIESYTISDENKPTAVKIKLNKIY